VRRASASAAASDARVREHPPIYRRGRAGAGPGAKEKETRFGADGKRYSRADFEAFYTLPDAGRAAWESAPTTLRAWRERQLQRRMSSRIEQSLRVRQEKQKQQQPTTTTSLTTATATATATTKLPPVGGAAGEKRTALPSTTTSPAPAPAPAPAPTSAVKLTRPPSPSAASDDNSEARTLLRRPPSPDAPSDGGDECYEHGAATKNEPLLPTVAAAAHSR
jgi:hypothetical protein